MRKRKILAMGGGGFSMEPGNTLLDQFFFSLAEKKRPNVCFIGTASGDAQGYIDRFYDYMKDHDVTPSHLSLFKAPVGSLRDFVLSKDVLYVGGGNTRNLMTLWREWGLDKIIMEAYQAGVVLGGLSAGGLCWFEEGVTDSIPGSLTKLSCMNLLSGSFCPHYDGESERRPSYQQLILKGLKSGYACDDSAAVYFENEKFVESVSSVPTANSYCVKRENDSVKEEKIPTRFLGI
ncbi:MAG: Type 1 glutamine amidotransferase-like domain-containing protein [Bacteriovorax sp.]